jgi:hypothetical protein
MLGEEEFAAAWADGQSLTLEQAITEILSEQPQQIPLVSGAVAEP